jgi:hypothetical protein
VYEFPKIPECGVPQRQVLAPRLLRSVAAPRLGKKASNAEASRQVGTAYPVSVASRSVASSCVGKRTVVLRTSELRPVEVRCVTASSVQSVLRQAFRRVPVSRPDPDCIERSVAFSVLSSPTFSAPKSILSSALQASRRAGRTEKVLRMARRLAKLVPVASA